MGSKNSLESSNSMGEWSIIDSNEENGHHTEVENTKEKLIEEEPSAINKTDLAETDEFASNVENIHLTQCENGVKFLTSNLNNLSRVSLLLFISFYVFSLFVDKNGKELMPLDSEIGNGIFTKMNPNQMHTFYIKDNELCTRLIEELKKIKTEPFLIIGKEGKKSQSVRSLLNELIINSEKLKSQLAELKLEEFTENDKYTIKPLVWENLKLRTDYNRRKYLEGDFENLKSSLNYWNNYYADLRLQFVSIYSQMQHDDNHERSNDNERDITILPEIGDSFLKIAKDAVMQRKSSKLKKESVQLPPPLSQSNKISEQITKDHKRNINNLKTINEDEISSHNEILQMLKEIKEKYYKRNNDETPKMKTVYEESCEKKEEKMELKQWQEKLIAKIAKAYNKFLDKNENGKRIKNARIELEISEQMGNQLIRQHNNHRMKTAEKQKRNVGTQQRYHKNDISFASRQNVSNQQKNIPNSSKDLKNVPKKKRLKKTVKEGSKNDKARHIVEDNKLKVHEGNSSDFTNVNSKEKRNIFKEKFSTKKKNNIEDSVYYKGQYNKVTKKSMLPNSFCKNEQCAHQQDDEDDDDTEDYQQQVAPYLKRRKEQPKAGNYGFKKYWDKPKPSKHFRESSGIPKRQFIPRAS